MSEILYIFYYIPILTYAYFCSNFGTDKTIDPKTMPRCLRHYIPQELNILPFY